MTDKPHLNLIVTGHVDHGKSTSMGHFLFDLGAVDDRTIQEYAKESEKTGAGDSFKYAWVLDQLKDERERGVTIDLAFQKFETQKYFYTLIDAPGHRDFIKNMITGASEADAAVIIVSAKKGEEDVALGPGGQAREHAFLLKTLGVNQIVVCINKMDDQTVKYSEARFNEAKEDVSNLLKTVGYNMAKIRVIPISGWTGENLVKPSTNMPWYKGPILFQALDEFTEPPKPIEKPLRVPIQDVYTITGVGTVPVGRVETGHMKVGDPVIIMPEGLPAEIKSIETHHTPMQEAFAGDNIGFNLRGVSKTDFHRGSVLGPPSNPPTIAKEFLAQIIVVFHPDRNRGRIHPRPSRAHRSGRSDDHRDSREDRPEDRSADGGEAQDDKDRRLGDRQDHAAEAARSRDVQGVPGAGKVRPERHGVDSRSRNRPRNHDKGPSREGSRKGVDCPSRLIFFATKGLADLNPQRTAGVGLET